MKLTIASVELAIAAIVAFATIVVLTFLSAYRHALDPRQGMPIIGNDNGKGLALDEMCFFIGALGSLVAARSNILVSIAFGGLGFGSLCVYTVHIVSVIAHDVACWIRWRREQK